MKEDGSLTHGGLGSSVFSGLTDLFLVNLSMSKRRRSFVIGQVLRGGWSTSVLLPPRSIPLDYL